MQSKLNQLGITRSSTGRQTCPQCSSTRKHSKDPCLQVTFKDDAVLYNCHHCKWSGVVGNKKYNLNITPVVYKKPVQPRVVDEMDKVNNYFASRGIKKDTLDAFKIGYNGREILFPYYKNGELVNVKYRTAQKTWRQEAQSEKTFYGLDNCIELVADTEDYTLTIVEGEIDAMSMVQAGIPAVSIPQGASDDKLECVANCFDFVSAFDNICIAVDSDEAGNKMKKVLLERFNKSKTCFIINWSKYDVKDANEALQRGGEELLLKAYQEKEAVPIKGIVDIKQQEAEILDYMFGEEQKGASTGWTNLDRILRIQGGCLMTITGFPSRGKSTVANNLLYNLTEKDNWKHLICSFENTVARHVQEFTEIRTGKDSRTDGTWKLTQDEAKESINYLSNKFFLYDTNEPLTVEDIIELATYAVNRYGIKTLTIDPYNRIKHPSSDREDKYIGEMLSKLLFFAKQYDVLVIFIAHPKKPQQGQTGAPTAYDISGSSDWYNMSDIVICVHRERGADMKLDRLTQVIVQKVKGHHLGDPSGGEIQLQMFKNRLVIA